MKPLSSAGSSLPRTHLMFACEKACAVPLRISCHWSSSVVVKKERRPKLHAGQKWA